MAYTDHIVVDGVQYDVRDKEAVSFAQEQTLTEAQQEQARENIGAGSAEDVEDLGEQVVDLKSQISDIRYANGLVGIVSANKANPTEFKAKTIVVGGAETANASLCVSGFVPVESGKTYYIYAPFNFTTAWGAVYDANQSFLSNISNGASNEYITVSGSRGNVAILIKSDSVAFARINCDDTETHKMLVLGESYPSVYIPYAIGFLSAETEDEVNNMIDSKTGRIINTTDNTIVGKNACPVVGGVEKNVAVGPYALADIEVDLETDDQSGRYNVAIGSNAMQHNTTGNHNTACGFQAMFAGTTGSANTAVGEDALMTIGQGSYNVAIGCRAMQSATAGDNNVAIGQGVAYFSDANHPTGSRNTMIGAHSGQSQGAGSDNIAIGYYAKGDPGLNHTIVIGNQISAQESGQMLLGDSNTLQCVLVVGGVRRLLVFNNDGSVTWSQYTAPSN